MTIKMKPQQQRQLNRLLAKYSVPFTAKPAYIDMREMSKNYSTDVIPWKDISDILDVMIGPPPAAPNTVDPKADPTYTIEMCWKPFSDMGILSAIQRDLIPDHVYGLEVDFDSTKISVILAMEDPVTGLTCPFDGHHTSRELYRQGWTEAPVALLRAPQEMIDNDPYQARAYLMRVAGEAFLSINLTHKKPVNGYNQFVIKVSFGDPQAVDVDNILKANNCSAVQIAKNPGEISHYPFLWGAYKLQDSNFVHGRYLDLALKFHRSTWPGEMIYGASLIGLANFFHKCERANVVLDKAFMDDLAAALKKTYRLSKFTHQGYKDAYETAHPFGSASDELIVTCGFVHTYNKHVGKVKLYNPELVFKVK